MFLRYRDRLYVFKVVIASCIDFFITYKTQHRANVTTIAFRENVDNREEFPWKHAVVISQFHTITPTDVQ